MIAEVHSITTCGRKAGWEEGGKKDLGGQVMEPASSGYGPQCLAQQALHEHAGGIMISVFDFTSVFNVLISHALFEPSGRNVFYLIKKQGRLTRRARRPLTAGAPARRSHPLIPAPRHRTLGAPWRDPPKPRSPPPSFQARRDAEAPGLDPLLRVIRMYRGPYNRSG